MGLAVQLASLLSFRNRLLLPTLDEANLGAARVDPLTFREKPVRLFLVPPLPTRPIMLMHVDLRSKAYEDSVLIFILFHFFPEFTGTG